MTLEQSRVNQHSVTMKKLTKQASAIARKIDSQYSLLKSDRFGFFETYHDTMLDQVDAAWEEVEETAYFEEKGEIEHAQTGIKNLTEALKFCQAVIKLQTMTDKLPEPIFG